MSLRVRERGPRRRCSSNRTLVRTIPGLQTEPPPVPLLDTNQRNYIAAAVSDYEGISTASWTSGSSIATPVVNFLYHHFVVANNRTDSYDAILAPIRYSPQCPAVDGGSYDGWQGANPTLLGGRMRRHSLSALVEVARQVIPIESHCAFNQGYTQPIFSGDLHNQQVPVLGSVQLGPVTHLAPETLCCSFTTTIYAFQFVINGTPQGLRFGNRNQVLSSRVTANKGDVIELDLWHRIQYLPQNSSFPTNGQPGKGAIILNTSIAATGATIPRLISWNNINRIPNFEEAVHTYEVTVSGHSGWFLKDGSNGPHRISTGGGWTRSIYSNSSWGRGLLWNRQLTGTRLWIDYGREVPIIVFEPGTIVSEFGGNPLQTFWYYRPRNNATQSYRKTTTMAAILSPTGVLQVPGGTVIHAPCGPFAQAGSTTFDLISWNVNLNGGFVPGIASGILPFPLEFVPTSITLNRVPL